MILAVVDDLLFRSKLEAVAAALQRPIAYWTGREALTVPAPGPPSLILIDLSLAGAELPAMIQTARRLAPTARVVGFGPHVADDLLERARTAGCDRVVPRSALLRLLPGWLGASGPAAL